VTGEPSQGKAVGALTKEFFRDYPDYAFCLNLAQNVQAGIITYPDALSLLGRRAVAAEDNSQAITDQLNNRTVEVGGGPMRIARISLARAIRLDERALKQVLEFYFKHPYAHGRTRRTRLLPRWLRAFFLNVLVGHACRRGIPLDYESYFQMLRLL